MTFLIFTSSASANFWMASDPAPVPSEPSSQSFHEARFKVVIIGSSSVGKTCIILRFAKNTYNNSQESTIGAAFTSKTVKTGNSSVTLNIWDTAGQERYRSLVPKYFTGAYAYIVVFDVTSPESFEAAKDWLEIIRTQSGSQSLVFFAANKIDQPPAFDLQKAQEYAQEEKLHYYETSAKTGQNINELFLDIAEKVSLLTPATDNGIDLSHPEGNNDKKCC